MRTEFAQLLNSYDLRWNMSQYQTNLKTTAALITRYATPMWFDRFHFLQQPPFVVQEWRSPQSNMKALWCIGVLTIFLISKYTEISSADILKRLTVTSNWIKTHVWWSVLRLFKSNKLSGRKSVQLHNHRGLHKYSALNTHPLRGKQT